VLKTQPKTFEPNNLPGGIALQKLPVMEAFYTLQGEGFHQGKAAYFIRLGGCDVGCVWCDVKDSWDESGHPQKTIGQIVEEAKEIIGPADSWRCGLEIDLQWTAPVVSPLLKEFLEHIAASERIKNHL
jgi:pyruvate-formate lyase-activating enzyme